MTREVNYFQKILKHQYPTLYNQVGVSVSAYSNYEQYLGGDGRMRAELNYNSYKQDITISFPNIGELYYDISFFIRFVNSKKNLMYIYIKFKLKSSFRLKY